MKIQVQPARFLRRYKRFFADVELPSGETVVCHVANSGSLKTCLTEGADCLITPAADPERKLRYSLRAIKGELGWIGVDTSVPNEIVWELYEKRRLADWARYSFAQREVKISDESRIDLILWNPSLKVATEKTSKKAESKPNPSRLKFPDYFDAGHQLRFIEVKNVTLMHGNVASFPDGVTERGQKHLDELMRLKSMGHEAEIFFTVQREGVRSFRPAEDIDPVYARKLDEARRAGVVIRVHPWTGLQNWATAPEVELSLDVTELPIKM